MASSPTTPPTPGSPSNITAPGLRIKGSSSPTFQEPTTDSSTSSPSPDPIDDGAGDTPSSPEVSAAATKVSTGALAAMIRGFVMSLSMLLHTRLATSDAEQQEGIWIATPKDESQIGDPIAAMASRRGLAEVANPDTADLIAAGIGIAGYLMTNIGRAIRIRVAIRRARQASGLEPAEQ